MQAKHVAQPALPVLGESLCWPSAASRDWVFAFAERVCADPNTRGLVLIGSIARQVPQCTDVDLLYIYEGQSLATGDHPLDVDIRRYSSDEVKSRVATSQDVISWSLRFGRVICEHDAFWTKLVRAHSAHLPLPNPDVAAQRAQRASQVYQQLLEMGDIDAALEQRITLLTHLAWERLLRARVHPASRPELPHQLRAIGEPNLAADLADALRLRAAEESAFVQQQATR